MELPPDIYDPTAIISLLSTVVILLVAYLLSLRVLPESLPGSHHALFIWHAFDALIHTFFEGSFLYHCFFSWVPAEEPLDAVFDLGELAPTAFNFLGTTGRVHGSQAGGQNNPFAQLWMVYARADKRWAGVDLVCLFGVFLSFRCPGLSRQRRRRLEVRWGERYDSCIRAQASSIIQNFVERTRLINTTHRLCKP